MTDLLSTVEAAYCLELEPDDWLRGLCELLADQIRGDLGLAAAYRELSDDGGYEIHTHLADAPDGFADTVEEAVGGELPELYFGGQPLRRLCNHFPEDHWYRVRALAACAPFGVNDAVGFICADDPHRLVNVSGLSSKPIDAPSPAKQRRLGRVRAHITAALRLRTKLRRHYEEELIEARLGPDGQILDAKGPAKAPDARELLQAAVLRAERARGRLRKDAPDEALDLWPALVDGRWSLIERFERDGRRYMVALENGATPRNQRALSPNEGQVAMKAAMGWANTEIAYSLGISSATVATHLRRALRKLGAKDRSELIRLQGEQTMRMTVDLHGDPLLVLVEPSKLELPDLGLTPTEQDVAHHIMVGASNGEIAAARGTATRTIANQIATIFRKAGVSSRTELIRKISQYSDGEG